MAPIEHPLERPEMYAGCAEWRDRTVRVLDVAALAGGALVLREATVRVPEALERAYLEPLANAGDNARRTAACGRDPGAIDIVVDARRVTIANGGDAVSVTRDAASGELWPSKIFGQLMTSENYGDAAAAVAGVTGHHGLGVKLTNIYSRRFSVECRDPARRLRFRQTWRRNMREPEPPVVEPLSDADDPGWTTRVEFEPNFEHARFRRSGDDGAAGDGHDAATVALYARHALDLALTQGVARVTFNGVPLGAVSPERYLGALLGLPVDGVMHAFRLRTRGARAGCDATEALVAVVDEGAGLHAAFVNGAESPDGGTHVQKAQQAALDAVRRALRDQVGPEARFGAGDAHRRLAILTLARLAAPSWSSQTKTRLVSPAPGVAPADDAAVDLAVHRGGLAAWARAEIAKRAVRVVAAAPLAEIPGGRDAALAGGPRAAECTLIVAEGESALLYVDNLCDGLPGGRAAHGAFALRGAPRNCVTARPEDCLSDRDFAGLRALLGPPGPPGDNAPSWRYGRVLLAPDSDEDGVGIACALLAFLWRDYRARVEAGAVWLLRTPVVRVEGAPPLAFYCPAHHAAWEAAHPTAAAARERDTLFCKGLGTDARDGARFDAAHRVWTRLTVADPAALDAAIAGALEPGQGEAHRERVLAAMAAGAPHVPPDVRDLASGRPARRDRPPPTLDAAALLGDELTALWVARVRRTLPRCDTLSDVTGKIVWSTLLHCGGGAGCGGRGASGPALAGATWQNLAAVATHVREACTYRHRDTGIHQRVYRMGAAYVGANNLAWFACKGSFGTRRGGGRDVTQPPYTSVRPLPWWAACFRDEDAPLLRRRWADHAAREPLFTLPVFPVGLANGVRTVSTGWSSRLPPMSPRSLVVWLLMRVAPTVLEGESEPLPPRPPAPYFRGFDGRQIVRPERHHEKNRRRAAGDGDAADFAPPATPGAPRKKRMLLETRGVCRPVPGEPGATEITELPPRKPAPRYLDWLRKQQAAGRLVEVREIGTAERPGFVVRAPPGEPAPTRGRLHLRGLELLDRLVVLDEAGVPREYASVSAFMEAWYRWRLPYYGARRERMLQRARADEAAARGRADTLDAVAGVEAATLVGPRAARDAALRAAGVAPREFDALRLPDLDAESRAARRAEAAAAAAAVAALEAATPESLWEADLRDMLLALDEYEAWLARPPEPVIDADNDDEDASPRKTKADRRLAKSLRAAKRVIDEMRRDAEKERASSTAA